MAVSHKDVQDYYGKTLQKSDDLQTNACCIGEQIPAAHKKILARIHEEILTKFYGCGSPLPDGLTGCVVLDLGSGTGRDVYLASAFVGEKGKVIGVDMTDEQLAVARKYVDYHAAEFGYSSPNVEFRKGFIEDLKTIGIEDNSVDVVISNCVINLSMNKKAVFGEIFRILKEGGELFFSDVFADRRVPEIIRNDKVLYGECLSGALYIEDFRRIMAEVGFNDVRLFSASKVTISNAEAEAKVKPIQFFSVTVRAFKISSLEDRPEDYGQFAAYLGGLPESPSAFQLDLAHSFPKHQVTSVDGNTAAMLAHSRFATCFNVTPRGPHRGCPTGLSRDLNAAVATLTSSTSSCCAPAQQAAPTVSGGCCGPKAAAPVTNGGCCGPKTALPANSGGCCGPKTAQPATSSSCCTPKTSPPASSGGCCGGAARGCGPKGCC